MRGVWCALAIALAGCSQPAPEVTAAGPVIVISIDTLRADRLSAYGNEAFETPAIDALADDGILFEHAFSPYPLTLPSHASILSGQAPPTHGVRDNIGYTLSSSSPHLAEAFRQRGFATAAFVSSYVLRRGSGIERGFDVYDDLIEIDENSVAGSQRSGETTLVKASDWIEERADDKWFLLIHFYEPHTPYAAPAEAAPAHLDPYDREVVWVDALVGRLVEVLKQTGVYDRATIVLLADHGEGLGDHGEQQHGLLLYRETVQVPLILKLSDHRMAGSRRATLSGLIDVAPTLAELAGLNPSHSFDGRSLLDPAVDRTLYSETHYGRLHLGWGSLTSVVDSELRHYILGPERAELFDLHSDPEERANVEGNAAIRNRLHRSLQAASAPLEAANVDDSDSALRSLGYLTTAAQAVPSGPLPDPRDEIDTLAPYWRAVAALGERRWDDAERLLASVVEAQPRMRDAWEQLAFARLRSGRLEPAVDAFQRALKLSDGDPTLLVNVGSLLSKLGRHNEARAHARAARDELPYAANLVLAVDALATGDSRDAESYAGLAIAADPTRPKAWILRARALARLGRPAEAEDAANRASERQAERAESLGDLEGYELALGDIAGRRGDGASAERHFRREIALFPDNLDAYTHLAVLLAASDQSTLARQVLREMTERNPGAAAEGARRSTLALISAGGDVTAARSS